MTMATAFTHCRQVTLSMTLHLGDEGPDWSTACLGNALRRADVIWGRPAFLVPVWRVQLERGRPGQHNTLSHGDPSMFASCVVLHGSCSAWPGIGGLISPDCEQPLDFCIAHRVTLQPDRVVRITVELPPRG